MKKALRVKSSSSKKSPAKENSPSKSKKLMSCMKYSSWKLGDLKERLKHAYTALHKEFRRDFEDTGLSPQEQQLTDDEKNTLYEQKASAWYQVTYHPMWVNKSEGLKHKDVGRTPVRLSFAWIAADYLVRLKVRCQDVQNLSINKPIDLLASYLADKI